MSEELGVELRELSPEEIRGKDLSAIIRQIVEAIGVANRASVLREQARQIFKEDDYFLKREVVKHEDQQLVLIHEYVYDAYDLTESFADYISKYLLDSHTLNKIKIWVKVRESEYEESFVKISDLAERRTEHDEYDEYFFIRNIYIQHKNYRIQITLESKIYFT